MAGAMVQANRQVGRQINTKTVTAGNMTGRQIDRLAFRKIDIHAGRQAGIHAERQASRQAGTNPTGNQAGMH